MPRLLANCFAVLLVAACGGGGEPTGNVPPPPPPPPPPPSWTQLIGRTLTVPAGEADLEKCTVARATSDIYITGFRRVAPVGSFRTIVTVSRTAPTHLGDFDCTISDGMAGDTRMIYAAGPGTDDYVFPEGIGIHIRPLEYVMLHVAAQNGQTAELADTTQVWMLEDVAANVTTEAEMMFVGTVDASVPAGETTVLDAGCLTSKDQQLLAVLPMGTASQVRQAFSVTHLGVRQSVLDVAFDPTNQPFVELAPPVDVHAGDSLQIHATFINMKSATQRFGGSYRDVFPMAATYLAPNEGRQPFACAGAGGT